MPLDEETRVRLSKKMTGLLRHYGPRYGLVPDREGWVPVRDLVEALRRIPGFEWVEERHVIEVVERDEKGRYELRGGMIRARYGHSLPVEPSYPPLRPLPERLYHGTSAASLEGIRRRGILPMRRRFVHLSFTFEDAVETGRRHGSPVAVLEVDPACLEERGIRVYRAGPRVAVARWVPWECVRRVTLV